MNRKNENFQPKSFFFFSSSSQNIDCGYTLEPPRRGEAVVITKTEAVLTTTHNLCFGAKIRKIGIPLHTPVLLNESGVQGGIHLHGHVFVISGLVSELIACPSSGTHGCHLSSVQNFKAHLLLNHLVSQSQMFLENFV